MNDKPSVISGSMQAAARDNWLCSDESLKLRDGSASGQYLENRLVVAFSAGMRVAESLLIDQFNREFIAACDDMRRRWSHAIRSSD